MSFFKDLNEDISQIADDMNDSEADEIIGDLVDDSDVIPAEDSDDTGIDEELLENYYDAEEAAPEAEEEPEAENDIEVEIVEEEDKAPTFAAARPASNDSSDQVTVITKGTTINGSIISDCSLNVMGTINGDINCVGKLTITGVVKGNSQASEVFVNTKKLLGNIDSDGAVKIGIGTVIIGDIKAGSGVIAGAVKGEVDITGPVVIDSTAIIKGNVKAKSVQLNNGAVLEGYCSLVYSDVDIDDIFDEN